MCLALALVVPGGVSEAAPKRGGGDRVEAEDAGGVIRTIAGTNQRGYSGDGGSAVSAAFFQPRSAAVGPRRWCARAGPGLSSNV